MRSTSVLALLLLALMAVHAVNAEKGRGGDHQLSEIELEEESEIEQTHNHWQFSPLVRLTICARLSIIMPFCAIHGCHPFHLILPPCCSVPDRGRVHFIR
jgi:hypothetical protein